MSLTKIVELDIEILLNLDMKDLKSICRTNKNLSKICNNEIFWKLKLDTDFPNIASLDMKSNNKTWKQYYKDVFKKYQLFNKNFLTQIRIEDRDVWFQLIIDWMETPNNHRLKNVKNFAKNYRLAEFVLESRITNNPSLFK